MSEPILSIRELRKCYASGTEALKPIDLDIRRGEIFALHIGVELPDVAGRGEAVADVERITRLYAVTEAAFVGEDDIIGAEIEIAEAAHADRAPALRRQLHQRVELGDGALVERLATEHIGARRRDVDVDERPALAVEDTARSDERQRDDDRDAGAMHGCGRHASGVGARRLRGLLEWPEPRG